MLLSPTALRVPRFLKSPLRALYEFHFMVVAMWHWLLNRLYCHPLFQARCATFGEGVVIDRLPFVTGHVEIHVGNNVYIGGGLSIMSGRAIVKPMLILKDRAEIGWNTKIAVNKEVVIEEHARVSYGCRISD